MASNIRTRSPYTFAETAGTSSKPLKFTRGAATQNDFVHPESRCNDCGFRISALHECLAAGEREHAVRCMGPITD